MASQEPDNRNGHARPPLPRIEGYRIVHEISQGAQAVVYRGVQESTGQRVAVKVLRHGPFATGREAERFEREVRILAALEHPNIVHILDRGVTAAGQSYAVMEYVEGVSLDEHLDEWHGRSRDIPEDRSELLGLFMAICEAVGAAHLRGVVHRDLKPTNIRVDKQGRPHILDFGLARAALGIRTHQHGRPVTVTGQFLGSFPYASPEQAQAVPSLIDARTDVYALGVILYRMLTRRFPYKVVGSPRDVLDNILRAEPIPPSAVIDARLAGQPGRKRRRRKKHRSRIDPVLDAVVLKALAKKREDRYQSAGELSRDVASYLSGRPTVAAGAVRRRRQSAGVVAGAVAVGCLAAAGAGLWHLSHRSAPPEPAEPRQTDRPARAAANPLQVYTRWPFHAAEAKRRQAETARALGVKVIEQIDLGHGATMKLSLIPAGKFLMGGRGSPEAAARKYGETAKRFRNEHPAREVTITQPFHMAVHEVTCRQFSAFVQATAHRTQAQRDGWGCDVRGNAWIRAMGASWRKPGFRQSGSHPAVLVSWDDAAAFCKWLSARTGRRVALPTEAQWEYACRAGTHTAYQWGDDSEAGKGWCNGYTASVRIPLLDLRLYRRRRSDGHVLTAPVGTYEANAFGLYDMHGNVWEWCADGYAGRYYSAGGSSVDPSGPATGMARVVRGGAWSAPLSYCRSATRNCRATYRCVTDGGLRVTVQVGGAD